MLYSWSQKIIIFVSGLGLRLGLDRILGWILTQVLGGLDYNTEAGWPSAVILLTSVAGTVVMARYLSVCLFSHLMGSSHSPLYQVCCAASGELVSSFALSDKG